MKKTLGAALASIMLVTTALSLPADAASMKNKMGGTDATSTAMNQRHNYDKQDKFIGDWCSKHRGDNDCNDWSHNRSSWNDDRYHSWYHDHDRDFGPGDAAASIFGFAAAAVGTALATGASGAHVTACKAKYGSAYSMKRDMWQGRSGAWHNCRL